MVVHLVQDRPARAAADAPRLVEVIGELATATELGLRRMTRVGLRAQPSERDPRWASATIDSLRE